MTNVTTQTVGIPARLAFVDGTHGANVQFAIKGSAGTHGDAGWTMFNVREDDVAGFMARNAAAAMPCWQRFENGKVVR